MAHYRKAKNRNQDPPRPIHYGLDALASLGVRYREAETLLSLHDGHGQVFRFGEGGGELELFRTQEISRTRSGHLWKQN